MMKQACPAIKQTKQISLYLSIYLISFLIFLFYKENLSYLIPYMDI